MEITDYIQDKKSLVTSFLTSYLKRTTLPEVSPLGKWGNDAVTRILNLTLQGKMLRSTLLFLSHDLFCADDHTDILLKAAAALELIQTGLVIHDDIMDQDEKRRGMDSMHIQYQTIFNAEGISDPQKTGESFAICTGDIAYFIAFQLLSSITPDSLGTTLSSLFAKENARVCVGQMMDVYGGQTRKNLTKDEILAIYEHKTARYTTFLPMVSGATIAGADNQTLKHITKIAKALGICFQIQDDSLNLFGDPDTTGKPVGSDIREGKQTLYKFFLMQKGEVINPHNPEETIERMKQLHIPEEVETIKKEYEQSMNEGIEHLPIPTEKKEMLQDMVSYILQRKK